MAKQKNPSNHRSSIRGATILSPPTILSAIFAALFIMIASISPVARSNSTSTTNSLHELVRSPPQTADSSNHHSTNINHLAPNLPITYPALPINSPIISKFVRLSNNSSSNARVHSSSQTNSLIKPSRIYNNNSDLAPFKSHNVHSATSDSQRRHLEEKMCMGTSNRMSGQHNKTDHYQNLAERYRNCTHVIGNLEITWLSKGNDNKPLDMTFLESIREITGYLLIAYVEVDKIRMPNLEIIRGRDLFRLNNGQREEFAMFLIENDMNALELPNLREILQGSVGSYNNRNLCYLRTINWDEILNVPTYKTVYVYNGTEPDCPRCHSSCVDNCWGDGPDMCQKFSKTICSPQCAGGRCFGDQPRECCHLFCAGGCTGPKQTDCIACKNFNDDGECIQECPSMMLYNPSNFIWEHNPNGKYAFGANCVKQCPDHLLRDNGACVRTCPPNKKIENGECVPCSGPCPKNCMGVEVVHSGNIDKMVNCTIIEGSITILDSSFSGYAEYHSNNTIGTRHKPMHPSRLDVFKTLREITGYLSIEASHPDFKTLSYFKNLQIIGGRHIMDMQYTLSIIKTSLVSLNLRSLKRVKSGKIRIEENKDLCFADTIDWLGANITKRDEISIRNNADGYRCKQLGLHCHHQCQVDGCWGPGPDECLSCKNYKLDDFCVDNCTSIEGQLIYNAGNNICRKCHPQCSGGCYGSEAKDCFRCKNVKDGPYCLAECPKHKYSNGIQCQECHEACVDGCSGPSSRLGHDGCNSCGKPLISSTEPHIVAQCIRAEDECPEGFYKEYLASPGNGPLKHLSGKIVCRKCDDKCKSCSGVGNHVSVCKCAKYQAGEQCEYHCPRDYYANSTLGKCIKCSPECNGCFGPTDYDCDSCRVYRLYSDSNSPLSSATLQPHASALVNHSKLSHHRKDPLRQQHPFRCVAQCPAEKPHRISEGNNQDPYCSENPGIDGDNPRVVWMGGTSVFFVIIAFTAIMFCVSIYRCQIEKEKTVKMIMHLSGIDDVEPLNPSNVKPNLAPLRTIKEFELRIGNRIGSGFGGTVYQGLWIPEGQELKKRPKAVAIKVLKDDKHNDRKNKEFLEEAYIMASVNHPNLVRLLGVCMTRSSLMLVTQLMPLGCLSQYVQVHKNEIGSKNLLEWCKQIAKGMAYLENHRMVHRDLALRNVLLQKAGHALISDFGLSKLLEINQSEYHAGDGELPIKWLAPECFNERKFTHKSDVWAFGVTIWELLSFGQTPFPDDQPKDVPRNIEAGDRLPQPPHVTTDVYKVLFACWFYNPENRPNFEDLSKIFVKFAQDPDRYLSSAGRGIDYSTRQELGRDSDSDLEMGFDNEFCLVGGGSDMNSVADEESHTRSANLIQPDQDEYLLPSPCTKDDKFTQFLASREMQQLPSTPSFNTRDPPHSAGLIGCYTNHEYFMTQVNYVNSIGSRRKTNASSGHIPTSLV